MHTCEPPVIKDHRNLFRVHSCSFMGCKAVDWLITIGLAPDRKTSVIIFNILLQNDVVHHVNDTESFRDDVCLYRFRQDDNTFPWHNDMKIFQGGTCAGCRLVETGTSLKHSRRVDGHVYRDVVRGCDLVTWMVDNQKAATRQDAVRQARTLLENHIIRHVTDKHHFKDDAFFYQFKMDMSRKRVPMDLVQPPTDQLPGSPTSEDGIRTTLSGAQDIPYGGQRPERTESGYHSDAIEVSTSCSPHSLSLSPGSCGLHDGLHFSPGNGVLVRKATIDELKASNSPFRKRLVRIASDAVGFGFVIRGEGPVFVKTVDPTGPAAAAGLKVGTSVTGVQHRGGRWAQGRHNSDRVQHGGDAYITLVIMEHTGDEASS
ncbi:hypothetical protein NP493_502g00034 [Ridgeia piscesae]|uniref:DEP domain-containing protein n=1 Tax=Ridgeia piscesae TaxID=27915 RepID=A0AAD9KX31_RIDPI|nr:hypothetical protein NP493_502g00034 [Ridgeia piscesae]